MTRETILAVPWVVLEDAPVIDDAPTVGDAPTPAPVIDDEETTPAGGWWRLFLALSVAWFALVAVLTLTGAMLPLEGNVLAYVVIMTWLFLACFTALTCPREEKPETFWTWGSEPVGQCTPSRNTLTGGRQ